MALRTTTNRTRRSAAVSRLTAVCALTGAALLATVTGGQAWADGVTPTVTPTAAAPAEPSSGSGVKAPEHPPQTPTARPAAPSVEPPKGQPQPATPTARPEGVQPTKPQSPTDAKPQVREVPKGAAQAGDGSGAGDSSGLKLVGGGAVAAVGAGALGFAMLRRRSGARG
ncbi:hypothetical protein [Kitasatospora purpeofusca]|uniref:hypothetical protein n=1 Tax=Kitasatospora purpeofusca TaxID=67352 RepID=UPI002A5ADBAA|nr:hypothetical protein [Kitasatospora purpeofusca]MDY0816394.1 hypothetical protein [Kitasatospora purpeofusca]